MKLQNVITEIDNLETKIKINHRAKQFLAAKVQQAGFEFLLGIQAENETMTPEEIKDITGGIVIVDQDEDLTDNGFDVSRCPIEERQRAERDFTADGIVDLLRRGVSTKPVLDRHGNPTETKICDDYEQ